MTKRQRTIITILALAVVCVFCTSGVLIVQKINTPLPTSIVSASVPASVTVTRTTSPPNILRPTQTASLASTPLPLTSTPNPTSTPTQTPTPVSLQVSPPTDTPLSPATPTVSSTAKVVAIPSFTPTPIVTVISSQQLGGIAKVDLNVRSGPGTNYPGVGYLKAGESISIVGKSVANNWWKFSQGWVSAYYIQANANSSAVPVVVSVLPLTATPKVLTRQTQPPRTSLTPVTPVPSDGASSNPWGYNFTCCNLISSPPANFCN